MALSLRDITSPPKVRTDAVTSVVAAARLADPACSVVTLTVTEKGYRHDPATRRLRLADPEIAAGLAGRPPRTVHT